MDFSRYEKLRTLVRANFSEQTQALVDEALVYADGKLASLTRYDGSPLLTHAAAVAGIVISEVGLGRNSTISAILHDVVRLAHKQLPAEEFLALTADIRSRFGEQVVGITIGMCNISELKLKVAKEQAENFRDLLVSYSEDPRVILIKLADRLEVMRSLEIFPREKWRKKSWESMNLYAQIAHKLGLYSLKSELEDIALKYLEPKDYEHIVTKLEESADERKAFIARFLVPIEERLHKLGIKYHIKSRTKSIFSIWTKMHKQHVPFEGVYDIFAIRIIIDCPKEQEKPQCWTAYSVVTDFYTPNPNRMRDWISIPKSNGYESLHTTVSAEGRWVEVQIRTERMDAVAERGIAAHWRYKGVNQGAQTSEVWLGRLRELLEDTTHSLAQRFDAKPASGEIFVFTPNGDLRKLPEGASLLDFAFDIHTSLGSTCVGGKVNNRAVSIREQLRNGDIVEIPSGWPGYRSLPADAPLGRLAEPFRYEPSDGARVGCHRGAHFFTIGQRKGLNVGGKPEPLFVIGTDVERNILYVGQGQRHPGLYRRALYMLPDEIHWVRPDLALKTGENRRYLVRIRYRQPLQGAVLYRTAEGGFVVFDEPQRGVTAGQFAAWYDGEELIGSGVIHR